MLNRINISNRSLTCTTYQQQSDDEDEGFSYPGYDSSGDDRSVTSSVDATVDASTELDRHPWRRTAAAAGGGGGTNTTLTMTPTATALRRSAIRTAHGSTPSRTNSRTGSTRWAARPCRPWAATRTRFIHFYCKIHLFKSKISRSVIPQNRTVRVKLLRSASTSNCRARLVEYDIAQ